MACLLLGAVCLVCCLGSCVVVLFVVCLVCCCVLCCALLGAQAAGDARKKMLSETDTNKRDSADDDIRRKAVSCVRVCARGAGGRGVYVCVCARARACVCVPVWVRV